MVRRSPTGVCQCSRVLASPLGGVGVALGVVHDLLVGPASGSLHPGGQPVHHHGLAGGGHLCKPLAQVVEAGDEAAIGLAVPHGGQRAKQQVQAVADLGLGDPNRPPGAPVRQPVQDDRGDGVQADLQRQWRGAALAMVWSPSMSGRTGHHGHPLYEEGPVVKWWDWPCSVRTRSWSVAVAVAGDVGRGPCRVATGTCRQRPGR